MTRTIRFAVFMVPAVALCFSQVDAQTGGTVDCELWIGGMVPGVEAGYARGVSPGVLLGVQVGVLAPPQITLVPDPDGAGQPDLDEVVHAAVFVRLRPTPHWEVDLGVRGGLGDLWLCPASDCFPTWFGGGHIQAMAGWERLKVGPRLSAGWVGETRESSSGSTFFLVLHPLVVRWTFPL